MHFLPSGLHVYDKRKCATKIDLKKNGKKARRAFRSSLNFLFIFVKRKLKYFYYSHNDEALLVQKFEI